MKPSMPNSRLHSVAMKRTPPDLVVTNGVLFNPLTGEFLEDQSIWIQNEWIAYAGPDQAPAVDDHTRFMDARGMVLLPGLIESHTHIMNLTGIEEFVKYVIPTGTTTVVTETIELATIAGIKGIEYVAKGLEDQPLRFYYTVSPFCGLTSTEERTVPSNNALLAFLRNPQCLGLGEIYWGNLLLEGEQGERVRELARACLSLGKRLEGHSAGASGNKLEAYAALGISSCHEPITAREVLERLRLGFWVMIRQGAIRKELDGVRGIFDQPVSKRRVVLCTDSMDPEGFLSEGCLDAAVRYAIQLGISPAQVYQMVTLNAAEHFRLDHLLGSLTPGRLADMLIIPSPEDFAPVLVMCGGEVIYRDGETLAEPRKTVFPEHMFHTVETTGLPPMDWPTQGQARAMEMTTRLVTKETMVDLSNPAPCGGLNRVLALDRTGDGGAFLGLLKGFGLERGACGSTMCWDTPDMIVVGCDDASMGTVIGRLKELGGGAVFAVGREVVAEFPAPLCGVVSLAPMAAARDGIRHLEENLRRQGVSWENPLLSINILGTAAIPHFRITHHGYVRLKDRAVLPVMP